AECSPPGRGGEQRPGPGPSAQAVENGRSDHGGPRQLGLLETEGAGAQAEPFVAVLESEMVAFEGAVDRERRGVRRLWLAVDKRDQLHGHPQDPVQRGALAVAGDAVSETLRPLAAPDPVAGELRHVVEALGEDGAVGVLVDEGASPGRDTPGGR